MLTPWSLYPTDEFGNPILPGMYQGVPAGRAPAMLPPVKAGSGKKITEDTTEHGSNKNVSTKPQYADQSTMGDVMDSLYKLAPIQSQLQGQEQMKNLLAMEMGHQHPQLDLSPLADLTNFVTHGQYKSTYKAPDNAAARNKMLMMGDKIQDDQRDLTKNIMQGVNAFKGSTMQQQLLDTLIKRGDQSVDPNQVHNPQVGPQASFDKEVRDRLEREIGQKAYDQSTMFNNIETALKSGDYAQVKAILPQFARGVIGDKGRIPIQEIGGLLPANMHGDWARFMSYWADTPTSQIDPSYGQSLLSILGRARGNAATRYGQNLENLHHVYKGFPYYTPGAENAFTEYKNQLNTLFPKQAPEQTITQMLLQKLMPAQGGK